MRDWSEDLGDFKSNEQQRSLTHTEDDKRLNLSIFQAVMLKLNETQGSDTLKAGLFFRSKFVLENVWCCCKSVEVWAGLGAALS